MEFEVINQGYESESWIKSGGGWTRTNEDRSREIYSLLPLPLGDTP